MISSFVILVERVRWPVIVLNFRMAAISWVFLKVHFERLNRGR